MADLSKYHLLSLAVFSPLAGFVICLFPRVNARFWGTFISLIPLALSGVFIYFFGKVESVHAGSLLFTERAAWIRSSLLNVDYALFLDGLSLPLVALTALLTTVSLVYSWTVTDRANQYYALFLLLETAMLGTFVAVDFILFFVFWELSLVPMYFIIGIWGGENRIYAAIKFFLYTLVGSVGMLLAFVWMYNVSPVKTFLFVSISDPATGRILSSLADYIPGLARTAGGIASLAWWGVFLAFAIKVPVWPFHTWLPDAHTEAPTAGSVILAGVLLKMGGYGMFRVLLPLLPAQSNLFAGVLILMAIVGVVYGALVAMAQWDLKRLIAYSSVNHMGYVMMGVAAAAALSADHIGAAGLTVQQARRAAETAMSGAVYEMVAHGLITGALFLIVGILYERVHTRDLGAFGGLRTQMPLYGGYFMFFFFASLGLPTLAGFIGELLAFAGTFPLWRWWTAAAGIGLVVTAAFLLWTIQRVLLGPLNPRWNTLTDMDQREIASLTPLMVCTVLFGIWPTPILNGLAPVVAQIAQSILGAGSRLAGL